MLLLNGVVFDLLVNIPFKLFDHFNHLIISLELRFLLGNSDDEFIAFEKFRDIDEPNVIANHLDLLLQTADFSLGRNLSKGIAHDGNEHIHEYNEIREAT